MCTRTKDALNGFKIYIERVSTTRPRATDVNEANLVRVLFFYQNEKPFNYMTYDEEEEEKRRKEYEVVQAAKALEKVAMQRQEENLEKIIKKQKEQQTKHNIDLFREAQKDTLDTQSQNIRMYLQDNLVTFLAEGPVSYTHLTLPTNREV